MPGDIFVCYRRETTSNAAGRIADRLIARFGEEQVFVDVDAIQPGVDWVDVIEKAVAACRVLLVVIGPTWHTEEDAAGRRRLEDPFDPVALEVRAGLTNPAIGVIPVLVDGAQMPRADDLPPDLLRLARINAARLEHATYRRDAIWLMEVVERVLAAPLPSPPPTSPVPSAPRDPLVHERPTRINEVRVPGRRGGRRRVVQCPRCAYFDLDAWNEGAGFAFACHSCRHRWRWIPGTAWPPTVVRPGLARKPLPGPV